MSIFGDVPQVQLATERIQLDLQRVGATLAQSARYEVERREFPYDELVHRLTSYVLSDRLVSDTYSKDYFVPASWWQHFKRDHLPTIARRWPVKTERRTVTVQFDRYATYPHARIAIPDLGRSYIFERVTEL